jgi:MoxR-like ATPase
MATQNPVEYEGTYPLPEAQLDRFLMKVNMGYPTFDEELLLLSMNETNQPIDQLRAILSQADVLNIRKEVDTVHVSDLIKRYILELVRATRKTDQVALGVSPRGGINLLKATKAYAYLMGRDYVIPDDVITLVPAVFCHRMLLTDEAMYQQIAVEQIITDILSQVDIPVEDDRI